jgi:hypothetical protein
MQQVQALVARAMGATTPATLPSYATAPFTLTITAAATRACATVYLLVYNAALLLLAGDEGRHPDKWRGYRLACRICAGVGLLVAAWVLLSGGEFLFKVSLLASGIATFAYLRKLAQRIPNSLLVRLCGIVLFAPVLSLLKVVPFYWFFAISELFELIEYVPLIYLPVTAVLLVWFARLLRRCSVSATESWAKESAPEGVVAAPTV